MNSFNHYAYGAVASWLKWIYQQERGTASEPFPIDWHLAGVPLPAFLLAQWARSSTISTSNAILSYAYYSRFIPLCKEQDSSPSVF